MSDRAQQLATSVEEAHETLIATLEACSDQELRTICAGETWPVVVTAHHVASSLPTITEMTLCLANGVPLPSVTAEEIDELNAQHAREYANVSREQTLADLRREVSTAAATVRSLTDEQLDRSTPIAFLGGAPWTTAEGIENVMVGHVLDHGGSIKRALGHEAKATVAA